MRLPTTFSILGHTILVERRKPGWDALSKHGECNDETGEIHIKEGLLPSIEDMVILHEVIHMIDGLTCLHLSEEQVEGLGNGLYQFLAENNFDVRKGKGK
jgi:hypothetical protein